jgi:hypothetical protein
MNKYSVNPEFKFNDEDMVDIISSAVYDIGYWGIIDNTTEDWQRVSASLPSDSTFEDIIWALLKTGNSLHIEDAENDDESYDLTLETLLNGIKLSIEKKCWNGNMDEIDGEVGDIIFQWLYLMRLSSDNLIL